MGARITRRGRYGKTGAWKVEPAGKNAANVITPQTRYSVKADKTSFTLLAFQGDRLIEKHYARHVGHRYLLQGTDRRGVTESLALNVTRKRVTTRARIGGRVVTLASKPYIHGAQLVASLGKRRRIALPLTHAFAERLRDDARFRDQIYRQVDLRQLLKQPDWVDQACAIACTLCYLLGEPLSCVICSLCTEPDPIVAVQRNVLRRGRR